MYYVIWKYQGEEEQRKEFGSDLKGAMRYQAALAKNKRGLEYAEFKFQ